MDIAHVLPNPNLTCSSNRKRLQHETYQLPLYLCMVAGFIYNGTAMAQGTAAPPMLEEIIVTAQKRAENVQDVPVTINVLRGEVLDNFGLRNPNDLADAVPGLIIQHTPQNLSQVTLRGLGTGAGSESLDQSVGLFLDGLWAGRLREFQASLFDIDRVEVIKGTQTALLGKNTSLGAVSIISRRPGETLSGYLQADYEFEYGSTYLTGAVDLPSDFGNYRLAFNAVGEEGYVTNNLTDNKIPEREQLTLRLGALYDLSNFGQLLLSYQHDDLEILGDTFQPDEDKSGFILSIEPTADIGLNDTKNAFTRYSSSGDAEDDQQSQRAFAQYDIELGDYQLTSLTGWTDYTNDRLTDSDFLPVDYLTTVYTSDYEQFSQEIRIASPSDEPFAYVAGLYCLDSTLEYSAITDISFPTPFTIMGLPLDGANLLNYDQDTEVWSIFAQGTFSIGDRWRVTVGLRYTDEEKDALWERQQTRSGGPLADIVSNILAPEAPPTPLNRKEDNLDKSINVQYDVTEDVVGYASWARGSKSGGFTTEVASPVDAEFETEEAETVEVGVKYTLANGAALLNAAMFQTEIDNFQITTFVGTGFVTETLPAQTKGMEFESRIALSENLLIGASATYSDAKQKSNNLRLANAPQWTVSATAWYSKPWPAANMRWQIEAQYNYRDEQFMQRDETRLDGALSLLNLRLGLLSDDERWEVALLGRNFLDQTTTFGFSYPIFGGRTIPEDDATMGSVNRPRTLALQLRYSF